MFRITLIGIVSVLVLTCVGLGTRYLGLWGNTVIERKVFEESYQRKAALQDAIASDEATLAEIEAQLTNPNLDEDTRANLEAQARAIRIRIRTNKEKLGEI